MNRPLGGQIAVRAAAVGMTPDQLTAVSGAFGVVGLALMCAVPTPWMPLVAAVLLLAGYAFDSADGQLARIQRSGGPKGEWLDHVVDGIRAPLVHIAVLIYLFRTGGQLWLMVVALLFSVLVSGWFLSQLLAEKLLPRQQPPAVEAVAGRFESWIKQPQDASSTYVVVALLGFPLVFAVLYGLLFVWHVLMFGASLARKYRQLSVL